MSLLIKALDKAEKAQADKAKKTQSKRRPKVLKTDFGSTGQFQAMSLAEPNADLMNGSEDSSLMASPVFSAAQDMSLTETVPPNPTPVTSASPSSAFHPDRAANIFAAKRIEPSHQNAKLAMLGGLALLVLLGIVWYVYQATRVSEPATQTRLIPPVVQQQSAVVSEASGGNDSTEINASSRTETISETDKVEPERLTVEDAPAVRPSRERAKNPDSEVFDIKQPVLQVEKTTAKTNNDITAPAVASRSVSVSVSKNKSDLAVNPALMRAYEAYNAGNDNEAQTLYKQVLQRDIRNVDALLGLGAIAARQGRDADADGWYRKVLELEPRNQIAQAAIMGNQDTGQNSESRLKVMIEKSPNDADLHAKLGHFYADQNQWAAAQQAYFEANRLNPNAENAFNLAVSLDQMGKSKLALPYYQRALETINNNSGIDKGALEARIQAIQ
ncbi:MAG TPA: hypothetical protein PLR90_04675 [Methylophilus sp.]|nr:hypothetical protein [Methylophilus sp.]HQQ33192.1 hypothetical protein [Methylophilus sp.]